MAEELIKVPDIGGAEGAEVVEVLVSPGETIEVEQSLVVVESDKALSDSTTTRLCSTSIVSPGETKTSTTSAPSAPPISGTFISSSAISGLLFSAQTRIGLGLSVSIPNCEMACSTTFGSRSP